MLLALYNNYGGPALPPAVATAGNRGMRHLRKFIARR